MIEEASAHCVLVMKTSSKFEERWVVSRRGSRDREALELSFGTNVGRIRGVPSLDWAIYVLRTDILYLMSSCLMNLMMESRGIGRECIVE